MHTIYIRSLTCQCATAVGAERIAYILLPQPVIAPSANTSMSQRVMGVDIDGLAACYGFNIVVVSGMAWNDDLTPWPAPPVHRGDCDFGGHAATFLRQLTVDVLPTMERTVGLTHTTSRLLMGISLSGLFALWAWMHCEDFSDVACLSASFWYDGFVDYFSRHLRDKPCGHAYFSLGRKETTSRNSRFGSVGEATDKIVSTFRAAGVNVSYELTSGTHFDPIAPRIEQALKRLA